MFFSNTNRTNLTNLVGCDMEYIRGIRWRLLPFGQWVFDKSRGQLNIRECFFFEHESHESNESCRLRPGMYSWDSGDLWSCIIGQHVRIVTLHGYRN